MFVVFPDADVDIREVLPGTLLAAVDWTLLGPAFSVYAAIASSSALYGVSGSGATGGSVSVLTGIFGGVLLLVAWF